MKKLSEYEGDEALDLLAELIEPAAIIMADREMANTLRKGDTFSAVKLALKRYKKEVTKVLALLNGENPAEYKPKLLSLPAMLMNVLNDKELMSLFTSQSRSEEDAPSGSATENTEEQKE